MGRAEAAAAAAPPTGRKSRPPPPSPHKPLPCHSAGTPDGPCPSQAQGCVRSWPPLLLCKENATPFSTFPVFVPSLSWQNDHLGEKMGQKWRFLTWVLARQVRCFPRVGRHVKQAGGAALSSCLIARTLAAAADQNIGRVRLVPSAVPCPTPEETLSFLEVFLCLSRACLGKMISFSIEKSGGKAVFPHVAFKS